MRVQVLAAAIFAAACAGCDVDAARLEKTDHSQPGEVGLVVVPLPQRTPFDGDAGDREAYLDYYGRGYLSALDGGQTSCCLQPCPHWSALTTGWLDGQDAGFLVWLEKNHPEECVDSVSEPPNQPQPRTAPSRRR